MYRYFTLTVLSFATLVVSSFSALAAPITLPSGLIAGDQYRLAFVTSTATDGTSSDINYYNSFVTNVANSVPQLAALGTTWSAIVSTPTVDAGDNTSTNPLIDPTGVPIYTLGNTLIASSYSSFWSSNHSSFFYTETGLAGSTDVWTGTQTSGIGAPGQQLGTSQPIIGFSYINFGPDWIYIPAPFGLINYPAVTTPESIYGISGVFTVPGVPEPSTMVLASLAAAALAVPLLRRRYRDFNS